MVYLLILALITYEVKCYLSLNYLVIRKRVLYFLSNYYQVKSIVNNIVLKALDYISFIYKYELKAESYIYTYKISYQRRVQVFENDSCYVRTNNFYTCLFSWAEKYSKPPFLLPKCPALVFKFDMPLDKRCIILYILFIVPFLPSRWVLR